MKYGLSDQQLKEITTIISSYPEVDEALIFGSRAINTFKEASDVDIVIKGKKADSFLAAKIKSHLEDETYLPFFFDIISFENIDNDELKKHIRQHGVLFYVQKNNHKKIFELISYLDKKITLIYRQNRTLMSCVKISKSTEDNYADKLEKNKRQVKTIKHLVFILKSMTIKQVY